MTLFPAPSLNAELPQSHGLVVGDRPLALVGFVPHVGRLAREDHQILGVVVVPVAVDVMYDLALGQRPAELLFGHDAMDRFSPHLQIVGRMLGLVSPAAWVGAVFAAALPLVTGAHQEGRPASQARPLASSPAADGVARLGTPSPHAGLAALFACVSHELIISDRLAKSNSWFSPACIDPDATDYPLFGAPA
jgi:hypothetical protein